MTTAQLAGSAIAVTALKAIAASGVSATAVLALASRPWRGRGSAASLEPWGPPLAVASSFAAGYLVGQGWPGFPPAQARAWILFVALVAGTVGTLFAGSPRARRIPLGAAGPTLAVLLPWVLLGFQREHHWGRAEGVLWSAGLGLLALVLLGLCSAHEARARGAAGTLGLAVALALGAGAYGLAGSAGTAQLAGLLALGIGACALAGLWRGVPGLGAAGALPVVLLHLGLLWAARYLAELHLPAFVLLSLVPAAAWPTRFVPVDRRRTRAVLAFLLPVVLAAASLALERLAAPPPSPYG